MQTKTYNVYKFDELTKEQKEKAIENLRDINTDYDWSEFTLEDETMRLKKLGYNDVKIYYSGFWSQGDGASFTATGDVEKLVKKAYRKYIDAITFTKSHQYEHEYTMSIDIDYTDEPMPNAPAHVDYINNLEKELLENARNEARTIYKRLETEYEYQTSDKAIIETIQANDYDFTSDGKID